MAKIFISYRREDAQHQADRLHAALKKHVQDPRRDIFIDIDNIPVGVDFVAHLDAKVAECEVLLALIGPGWLDARNPQTGTRRLDDPEDFVRVEIASALKRGIPVAPILLDGASMPSKDQLPDDLRPLVRRNGVEIRRNTFEGDAERMIRSLDLQGRTSRTGRSKWLAVAILAGTLLTLSAGIVLAQRLQELFSPDDSSRRMTVMSSAVPVTGPRRALVIAQTDYNNRNISRVEDAGEASRQIAGALSKLDFEVTSVHDATRSRLMEIFDQFSAELQSAGPEAVGFIYYAGHAAQNVAKTDSFLLGTDVELSSAAAVEEYGVSLTGVRDLFGKIGAKGVVMVADASRDIEPELKNSVAEGYVPWKGLAEIQAVPGLSIVYSATINSLSSGHDFAPILADELTRPGQTIEAVFVNTKDRVVQASNGAQLPWIDSKTYGLCLSCPTDNRSAPR